MAVTRITGKNILDGTIKADDVHADYKDGITATPSLRTLGTGAQQACAGNDARLSDDRVASGLRTATTVVAISSSAAPTAGQILVALDGTSAEWQDSTALFDPDDMIFGEVPTGTIDGINDTFTLANTPVAGTERVYLNGIRMKVGAAEDYTIVGGTITFNAAQIPETGDALLADYLQA